MKKYLPWFLVFSCFSFLPLVRADIEFVYVIKEKVYRQSGNDLATEPAEWNFGAGASGTAQVTAASVTYPGSGGAVAISGSEGEFDLDPDGFASKAELDAAFPNGQVSLSVTDGGSAQALGPYSLSGDSYPVTPHLTNVADLESHDFTQSFELTWNSFTGADASSLIILQVWDDANDSEIIFEFLDSSATSFTIPANTFSADNYYDIDLIFIDETAQDGAVESIVGYLTDASYELSTQTSDTELRFYKWKRHEQSALNLIQESGYKELAVVTGNSRTVSYAELNTPAGNHPLAAFGQNAHFLTGSFVTKGEIDAAYPDGEYRFWLNEDGQNQSYGTYYLSGDAYPNPPQISNYNALQSFDPTQDQLVSLGATPAGVDAIDIRVYNGTAALVWSVGLASEATSATLPANTLSEEEDFEIVVRYWAPQTEVNNPPTRIGFISSTHMTGQTSVSGGAGGGLELAYIFKERIYSQSGNGAPSGPSHWSFNAGAEGGSALQAATVTYPSGSNVLTGSPGEYENGDQEFGSQEALDAAFADGAYSMNVTVDGSGQDLGPFSLTGSGYPAAPQILNFDELKAHDFTQAFDLNWNSFAGAGQDDIIVIDIWDETANQEVVSEFLDATATTYQIPANTIQQDHHYEIELLFLKATDGSESPQVVVGYMATTVLSLSTHTSDTELMFFKWMNHLQTGVGTSDLVGYRPFTKATGVSSALSYAQINVPGTSYSLNPFGDNAYLLTSDFGTKADLDSAYPTGDYRFWVGEDSVDMQFGPYALPADAYPTLPLVQNYDEIVTFDATAPQTITWGTPPAGVTYLEVVILSGANLVWSATPALDATSVDVPANTLDPQVNYTLGVRFWATKAGSEFPSANVGYVSSIALPFETNAEVVAPGIEFLYLFKEQAFEQYDNTAPVSASGWEFGAGVSGGSDVQSGSVAYPGGSDNFSGSVGDLFLEDQRFATQQLLDAAYANGNYSAAVTVGGVEGSYGPYAIDGDAYPPAPHLTNVMDIESLDLTQDFELTWTAFAGSEEGDRILLQVRDQQADDDALFEFLPRTDTSFIIPGNTFDINRSYEIGLYFINQTAVVSSPDAIVGYLSTTFFELSTFANGFPIWLAGYFSESDMQDPAIVGKTADPDGDGQDNYFEFLAKFDPTDGSSRLQHQIESGVLKVWPINEGVFWEIRYSDDLLLWTPVGSGEYRINGNEVELDVDATSDAAFYRFFLLEGPPANNG